MNARTIRALLPIYGTTFADVLGYTLLIPLLPTVVRQFHASDVMAGALLSVPALCSALAAPVWGKLSDRLGRKAIVVGAQAFSLIGYLLLAMSHGYTLILISRVISGFGGGSLGAVQSYIADVTRPNQRDRAYSIYGAVFGVAFVIGPGMGGALMHHGLSTPFLVAAGLEAANIIFTLWFLPLTNAKERTTTSVLASLRAAAMPRIRIVFIAQFLFVLAIVCFLANFGLYLQRVLHLNIAGVSWLLAVAGAIGGIVLVFVVTPVARRIGNPRVVLLGLLVSLIAYSGLAAARSLPLFCVVLVLWAIGAAMVQPAITSMLSTRAAHGERGAIMGAGDSINSVAMMIGPAAGAAIVGSDPSALGGLSALLVLVALVLGIARPAAFFD